jgi:hypothetical protein
MTERDKNFEKSPFTTIPSTMYTQRIQEIPSERRFRSMQKVFIFVSARMIAQQLHTVAEQPVWGALEL